MGAHRAVTGYQTFLPRFPPCNAYFIIGTMKLVARLDTELWHRSSQNRALHAVTGSRPHAAFPI